MQMKYLVIRDNLFYAGTESEVNGRGGIKAVWVSSIDEARLFDTIPAADWIAYQTKSKIYQLLLSRALGELVDPITHKQEFLAQINTIKDR